jgi:hypothetical protein
MTVGVDFDFVSLFHPFSGGLLPAVLDHINPAGSSPPLKLQSEDKLLLAELARHKSRPQRAIGFITEAYLPFPFPLG